MKCLIILVLLIAFLGGCGSKESGSINTPSKSQTQAIEERQVEAVEVIPRQISY
jgi:PBP1b-binding outer membrane lipoprotein LpoB